MEAQVLRTITSRFASKCGHCGNAWDAGDRIAQVQNGQPRPYWVHVGCVVKTAEVKPEKPKVKRAAKPKPVEGEHFHPIFQQVWDHAVRLRKREYVWLVGPKGCGKTHLAEQVAHKLNVPFGFISGSGGIVESAFVGMRVEDRYLEAECLTMYEKTGGLFLFDEVDKFDSNVIACLNAALANGKMAVPKRYEKPQAKKHSDFFGMAASNTYGMGADRQYCASNQLPADFIDRFTLLTMDYDVEYERKVCPDDKLLDQLWAWRKNIREARLERGIGTRQIERAYGWVHELGQDIDYVAGLLFNGWRPDEVAKAKGGY